MTPRTIMAALVFLGCRGEGTEQMRMPLAPARPVSFDFFVPPQELRVAMLVPADFDVHPMANLVVASGSAGWFPRLELQTPDTNPLGEPVKIWDDTCKIGDDRYSIQWTVAERVPEENGVLLVCMDLKTKNTSVVREFTWEGHPIQCSVAFGPDEPNPSGARLAEAKQLCDSVVLRRSAK